MSSGHRNYTLMIRNLLMFKSHMNKIDIAKYKSLQQLLNSYEFDPNDEDWNGFPDNKKFAELLGKPRTKSNQLILGLYEKVLESFFSDPPKVKKKFHLISISIPSDERQNRNTKRISYDADEEATWIEMELAETPRIGEEIDLAFVDRTNYTHGYVHEVTHTITGYSQEIHIRVHPFHNYYYQWKKLKNRHDSWEKRWRGMP